jgi:hypothetical protein
MTRKIRLYVSGPMSGIKDLNAPLFNAEAARLRALGYDVVNPAELNGTDMSWKACMRRDIRELVTCDAIAMLPKWWVSRGARIEHRLARDLGLQVFEVSDITEPLAAPTRAADEAIA